MTWDKQSGKYRWEQHGDYYKYWMCSVFDCDFPKRSPDYYFCKRCGYRV